MTDATAQTAEQQFASLASSGEGTVGVAIRTGVHLIERVDIGRECIELGTEAGLRIAERLIPGAGCVNVVREKPETIEYLADLMLQVLYFVEIAGPVQAALAAPLAPQERDGVAQSFARR